jgi:hypothetical protein
MQAVCPTSGNSARRNVNLLISVRRDLSYSWGDGAREGLIVRCKQSNAASGGKPKTHYHWRIRHAFVARRMVARFNRAI